MLRLAPDTIVFAVTVFAGVSASVAMTVLASWRGGYSCCCVCLSVRASVCPCPWGRSYVRVHVGLSCTIAVEITVAITVELSELLLEAQRAYPAPPGRRPGECIGPLLFFVTVIVVVKG